VRAERAAAPQGRLGLKDVAFGGLIVIAVLAGWQIAIQPFMQRAPVDLAISLAPGSPMVLRRAAESELAAGRIDNARSLSRDALVRSPFDVRALRIVGLTEAQMGREASADEILTLAGNWSLRDDPTHAWLVERRLRRGDYASAFAHADTLVRRREDIQPQVFRLFTVAGAEDPQRSTPVIASLLAASPPWRRAFLESLNRSPQDLQLAANLAVLLQKSRASFSNDELRGLYRTLLDHNQLSALNQVRQRLGRPSSRTAVTNSGFSDDTASEPFQWRLSQKAGIVAEIVEDDLRADNQALRVDYDGFAAGMVAEQLTSLSPGAYRFSTEMRTESGGQESRLAWTLTCATDGAPLAALPVDLRAGSRGAAWTTLSGRVQVPQGCQAQWLRLETRAGDSRAPVVLWFDRVLLAPET
jgi:hypothetical protein